MYSRAQTDDSGVGLIELVVASAVFVILISGVAATIYSTMNVARQNRHRVAAANVASSQLEELRTIEFADLETANVGRVEKMVTIGATEYTVITDGEWVASNAEQGGCQDSSGAPTFLRFTVQVHWDNMRGTDPIRSQTIITPPVGSYDPYTGHISVTVLNASSEPLSGVPITVTGPNTDRTITTTETGCVFFDHLNEDSYTVSAASSDPAITMVDMQGETAPAQLVGVTIGQTSSVTFSYDTAASLSLTLTGPSGYATPIALPLTLANTGLVPTGTLTVGAASPAVSPMPVTGLFPFASGYEVWGGSCTDADPAAFGDPDDENSDPGEREPALVTTAGQTTAGNVVLGGAQVTVTKDGLPLENATLRFVHAPDSESCTVGESFEVATTDAAGLLNAGVPFGTWTIEVVGEQPVSAWPEREVSSIAPSPSVQIEVVP